MHKFLRSVGFSEIYSRAKMLKMINEIVTDADERSYISSEEDVMIAEFSKDYGHDIGITVCGIFDEQDKFYPEYYFPYLRGHHISTQEDISVERHAARESYAGVCDDLRIGVSIIFYVQNRIPYMKVMENNQLPMSGTSLTLCGLSTDGCILLPVTKNEMEIKNAGRAEVKRQQLLQKARNGDEAAIETLSIEDLDMYNIISRKIRHDDVFTLVDTSFMPYGVECDQYSIVAEILACHTTKNRRTGDIVHIMQLICNDLPLCVCINDCDLVGLPKAGRRFKGTLWLQGRINIPND